MFIHSLINSFIYTCLQKDLDQPLSASLSMWLVEKMGLNLSQKGTVCHLNV